MTLLIFALVLSSITSLFSFLQPAQIAHSASLPMFAVLGLGLAAGIQHALDADHLAAVATIVSERKHWLSSSIVGGLWGVGHTVSLLIAGVFVIILRIQISGRIETILEMCVGIMLVGLGARALWKLAQGGRLHWHEHQHGGHKHAHPHVHGKNEEHESKSKTNLPTHHGFKLSPRPLLVGMMHGMAGSAALMLLVLTTIPSPVVGLVYIAVFGIGSIGGMMIMSSLIGLPFHFTATRFSRANFIARTLAGLFSVGFGLFMIYEKGFVEGALH